MGACLEKMSGMEMVVDRGYISPGVYCLIPDDDYDRLFTDLIKDDIALCLVDKFVVLYT